MLTYSMDKPRFIRALLEEVGTAIDPITLVRRIPEGLEIEGLREGLKHIMKEHEIQYSICEGAAKVLRSEVAAAQGLLRVGQRKGVKFEVAPLKDLPYENEKNAVRPAAETSAQQPQPSEKRASAAAEQAIPGHINGDAAVVDPVTRSASDSRKARKWAPGHCAECLEPFVPWESETLVGFACGHVFHVSHLLQRLYPGQEVDEVLLRGIAEPRASATHLIGAKVTHARLLKDRIAGGCPVCADKGGEGR